MSGGLSGEQVNAGLNDSLGVFIMFHMYVYISDIIFTTKTQGTATFGTRRNVIKSPSSCET